MNKIKINYQFRIETTPVQTYELVFDESTMILLNDKQTPADWTKLENQKCSHCPLDQEKHPHCPIALNLATVAAHFAQEKSFKEVTVIVTTEERSYLKKSSLQEGLQGIFGLIMATSGCPHMDFLRPMARFHLPFASLTESMVRSFSFHLLKKYFEAKDNKINSFDLTELDSNYGKVAIVNKAIISRIRSMSPGDADRNAIVILDTLTSLLKMELSGEMSEIRKAVQF